MRFTFYIDESGNFEDGIKDWVVAGLLLPLPRAEADKVLNEACRALPGRFGEFGRSGFHLTELRRANPHKALQIAEALLDAVQQAHPSCEFVATVNRMNQLSDKTKTYHLMLIDLISLADTLLPNIAKDNPITGLDFIIASRSIDGTRSEQHATLSAVIQKSLATALEVDLASRGLVSLLNIDTFHIDVRQANDQWGTIAADFVANLVFNRGMSESGPIVSALQGTGKLRIFQGMGSYGERRARIAERDGELVTALYRWCLLGKEMGKRKSERANEMEHLCRRILTETGSTGPRWSTDILIDLVHRNKSLPTRVRAEILADVQAALQAAARREPLAQERVTPLLLRLLNYQLLNANRSGDVLLAEKLLAELQPILDSSALNPEEFAAILNCHSYAVESALNAMDPALAMHRADKYTNLTQQWRIVWSLLHSGSNENEAKSLNQFDGSDEGVRAASASLRVRIQLLKPEDPSLDLLEEEIAQVEAIAESQSNKNRLRCYRVSSLLRRGRCREALDLSRQALNITPKDSFLKFWVARSLGDCFLTGKIDFSEAAGFLEQTFLGQKPEHYPEALMWREVGLLRLLSNNSMAKDWIFPIQSSSEFFKKDAHLSALNKHLYDLSEQHLSFCHKTNPSPDDAMQLLAARRRSPE